MRFKAKQMVTGDWAVFYGNNRFYPHTISKSQAEAEKLAIIKTANWHMSQVYNMEHNYTKHIEKHENRGVGMNEWGDMLA